MGICVKDHLWKRNTVFYMSIEYFLSGERLKTFGWWDWHEQKGAIYGITYSQNWQSVLARSQQGDVINASSDTPSYTIAIAKEVRDHSIRKFDQHTANGLVLNKHWLSIGF